MQGAQTREQLFESERFREVIVSAHVEAGHTIVDGIARGQHHHRRPYPSLSQPSADLESIRARQHHVKKNCVVIRRACHPDRVLTSNGDVRRIALLAKTAGDQIGELALVLY
jgi:hypothetical protein